LRRIAVAALVPRDAAELPRQLGYLWFEHRAIHQETVAEEDGRPGVSAIFERDARVADIKMIHEASNL
jgi:hypothetical protein